MNSLIDKFSEQVEKYSCMKHIDSWKDSESAFTHQLNRNKEELDNNYPPHWNNFIERVNAYPKIKRIVDIGSGAGVYCKLAEQLNKDYIGL